MIGGIENRIDQRPPGNLKKDSLGIPRDPDRRTDRRPRNPKKRIDRLPRDNWDSRKQLIGALGDNEKASNIIPTM